MKVNVGKHFTAAVVGKTDIFIGDITLFRDFTVSDCAKLWLIEDIIDSSDTFFDAVHANYQIHHIFQWLF